uniref:Uncharacterized protein n=1 Tax=Eutreptiella gymnastica TaxID=73025 RepID=A0A7S4C9Y6_9EUGL|mmetsp:Transcript_70964/g.118858  ORF Transcript_70964/g.118858 Transcript_70964/m.118858 type:complete len:106 (+) Transcript_70964:570-887(+)
MMDVEEDTHGGPPCKRDHARAHGGANLSHFVCLCVCSAAFRTVQNNFGQGGIEGGVNGAQCTPNLTEQATETQSPVVKLHGWGIWYLTPSLSSSERCAETRMPSS